MNNATQKQINQHPELQTQIGIARDTIAAQNQHITELYSAMSVIIGTLTLVVAVFGIAVPLWTAKKSKDMEKDLKENIVRIDDFITNKFKEWENQKNEKVLEKYLDGTLNWDEYMTSLKWQPLSAEHLDKIFKHAVTQGNKSPHFYAKYIKDLACFLFIYNNSNNNENYQKYKKLIFEYKYFPYLALYICQQDNNLNPDDHDIHHYILANASEQEQQTQLKLLLDINEACALDRALRLISLLNLSIDNNLAEIIAEKIFSSNSSDTLPKIENNNNIVDLLIKKGILTKISNLTPLENYNIIKFFFNGVSFHLSKESYLASKIMGTHK